MKRCSHCEVSRRSFLRGIGAVSAAGVLAACAPAGAADSAESTAEAGSAAVSAPSEPAPVSEASAEVLNTNSGLRVERSALEHLSDGAEAPVVYYTASISSDALMSVYQALGRAASGRVAVKLSTGENNSNFLSPDLIKALVQSVNGTIVECNTAYGGNRSTTESHRQLIEEHGFTAIADVDIMDADGSMSLPVEGGSCLTEDLVGSHLANYDFVLVLSHFKGHSMGGFGGALKNISIGIASAEGKNVIHTAGETHESWMPYDNFRFLASEGDDHNGFVRSMAEAAKAVSDYEDHGERMLYINVMNRLSVDCDCVENPTEPTMQDVAILGSTDPVALDQACVDLVYALSDSDDLIERIESRNGLLILEHAAELGLGSRNYQLTAI